MKNLRNFTALFAAALALCLFASCSNSSGGGGDNTPQPQKPTIYTITFNANDGSQSPDTCTQSFTEGTQQALKTISELGFSKTGFSFAGWGTSSNATESTYADGTEYTASANITFYALWSVIPVFCINVETDVNGSVLVSPVTGSAGTIVTVTANPTAGYELVDLTVTIPDGTVIAVSESDNIRTFTMPADNVTVSASFSLLPYKKFGTKNIKGVEYDLVTFGMWPQTIKADDVTVYENVTKVVGAFTYCNGSDGQWYIKIKENACGELRKYSNGTNVAESSANTYKWFKVEPIKWRVLTTNYNGTGKKLFLAEDILAKCAFYDAVGWTTERSVGGITVYANNYEYSRIRAFLNGLCYPNKQGTCNDFLGKGFLQTAFSSTEQARIADTSVNNSGDGPYYSNTPTIDKIFLLSCKEVDENEYGFDHLSFNSLATEVEVKLRYPTDYAKASGAWTYMTVWQEGSWYLRTPYDDRGSGTWAFRVCNDHFQGNSYGGIVSSDSDGVVPALCVKN